MAVANIFEPERFGERFAWAKTAALMEAISSYFNKEGISAEQRLAFVNEFDTITTKQGYLNNDRYILFHLLYYFLTLTSVKSFTFFVFLFSCNTSF